MTLTITKGMAGKRIETIGKYTSDEIDSMFDTYEINQYTFMILSLLYPNLNYGEIEFHQDHMHPHASFEENNIKDLILPNGEVINEDMKEDSKEDSSVELVVENGPAHIDEQHLSHLFEAFYRADSSNKDGSGLGLYISGMVLEMCGAEYGIENVGENVRFRVNQL